MRLVSVRSVVMWVLVVSVVLALSVLVSVRLWVVRILVCLVCVFVCLVSVSCLWRRTVVWFWLR